MFLPIERIVVVSSTTAGIDYFFSPCEYLVEGSSSLDVFEGFSLIWIAFSFVLSTEVLWSLFQDSYSAGNNCQLSHCLWKEIFFKHIVFCFTRNMFAIHKVLPSKLGPWSDLTTSERQKCWEKNETKKWKET